MDSAIGGSGTRDRNILSKIYTSLYQVQDKIVKRRFPLSGSRLFIL